MTILSNKIKISLFALAGLVLFCQSCTPSRIDEMSQEGAPQVPEFTLVPTADNPNKFVVTDLSQGNFQRLWSAPAGTPKTSKLVSDTILFSKMGEYKITLWVSKEDGSGSAFITKTVKVDQDAALSCSPKLALLTGDCNLGGKCWTMSKEAAALVVGPTYDDFSWYTAPADGLQPQQYDDRFCFTFENLVFENRNNGLSVNPWDGYKAVVAEWGKSEFQFLEGTGISGRDQIVLEDLQWMGVWDCDNVLDIIQLTSTKLVVRGRQRAPNGDALSEGWFQLNFVAL